MTYGRISPAFIEALYGSETKFGYEGKARGRYLHLIEGQRYTLAEVHARLPHIPYYALDARLLAHAQHTWAELGVSEHERRSAAAKKVSAKKREAKRARRAAAAARVAEWTAEYQRTKDESGT